MASLIYNLILIVLSPVTLLYFLWRVFVSGKSRASWRENLGALPCLGDRPSGRKLVWLHAVSVGEVVASLPIQDAIRKAIPDAVILVTTITRTGNDMARKSAKAADAISYLPLDYPFAVSRAFNRVRPDALIVMEAEVWPNLIATARRRDVQVVLANGRVSDRAMRRSLAWRWLMSWAYARIDHCCMQTDEDAQRILKLGAHPTRIRIFGSTKFDQEGAQLPESEVQALRSELGIPDRRQVFVAGSTNPGEDEPVIEAFRRMRGKSNKLLLVIAPRQIERGDEIRAIAEAMGLKCVLRSKEKSFAPDSDVLVLDTLGELAKVYAVGDITFVGGTLIPKGGHSLVQPMLQGKPVLFGPHTFKTRDIAAMVLRAQIGFEVADAGELATRGSELLADPDRLAAIRGTCLRLVSNNQGASVRCAELVAELLGVKSEV